MNFVKELKFLYIGGMIFLLGYSFTNFLWEIWNEQMRYKAIWVSLSFEHRIMANYQMIGQDFLIIFTVFIIIYFIKSEF